MAETCNVEPNIIPQCTYKNITMFSMNQQLKGFTTPVSGERKD